MLHPKTLTIKEHPILTRCLQQLNQLPSLQASCDRDFPPELDGYLRVRSPQESVGYLCKIKTSIKPESIGAVLSQLEYHRQRHKAPLLLLTNYLPDNIIGQLNQDNLKITPDPKQHLLLLAHRCHTGFVAASSNLETESRNSQAV
jgi:hypothetical protein